MLRKLNYRSELPSRSRFDSQDCSFEAITISRTHGRKSPPCQLEPTRFIINIDTKIEESNEMPSPIQVKRIDHITLVVKDLDVSKKFYVDLLGMEPVPRPNFSFTGMWFQSAGTQIHLILEHDESGPAEVFIPEKCSMSRTRHFAFEVDNAMEVSRVLNDLDIEIVAGPKSRPDGPTQLYIMDPDQNLVELYSYTPLESA